MRKTLRDVLAAGALLLAWASPGAAQGPSGTVNGQVVDQSGAAIPGVTVTGYECRHRRGPRLRDGR